MQNEWPCELWHWAECATGVQVRTPWWMIRVIMTSTLWLVSWSCILEGWKTRCSRKNVSSISYPQPVSHIPGDWLSLSGAAFSQVCVFPLLFRARLWCRKSSSASPDNRDPSAARDRRHEILVCLPESVSLCIAFAVIWDAGKWITAASIFLVFLSTATRTWWIPTT